MRNAGVLRIVFALLMGCAASACLAQSDVDQTFGYSLPVVHTLTVFKRTPVSAPSFDFLGAPQCDGEGTMYFEAGTPVARNHTYVAIPRDGGAEVIYALPQEVEKSTPVTAFAAAPGGGLRLLVIGPKLGVWIYRFRPDGEIADKTKLDAPPTIIPDSFATTAGGYTLLTGFYPDAAHSADDGKTYRAIFDANGNRTATLPAEDAGLGKDGFMIAPSQTRVTTSGDLFYWTDGKRVFVMDVSGHVTASYSIPKPDPKERVQAISASGGMIEITVLDVVRHQLKQKYLVINALSGEVEGIYAPPEGITAALACFDSKNGFMFLQGNHGHPELLQALLP